MSAKKASGHKIIFPKNVAFDDPENGDSGEDSQGQNVTASGNDEPDDSASGQVVNNPEAQKRASKEAKYRTERNQARKELEAAQKRLKEIDDQDKSALERAESALKEHEEFKREAEERIQSLLAQNNLLKASQEVGKLFVDPDAFDLFFTKSQEDIVDDDGEIDTEALKAAAETFLKEKPVFAASAENKQTTEIVEGGGSPTNGRRTESVEGIEGLKNRFPALSNI